MPIELNGSDTNQTPEQKKKKQEQAAPAVTPEPQEEIGVQPELTFAEPTETPESQEISIMPPVSSPEEPITSGSTSDANSITVTISDNETPIVILYGPQNCGKTMALIRLTRYLKDKGYQVVPDKNFRGSQDQNYQLLCDNFDSIISSNDAAGSTDRISFLLVKVLNNMGHPICQILEAPGEHYYPATNGYPPYISKIINSQNRKIWAVILEPRWKDENIRRDYVNNIKNLNRRLNNRSKVLFIYNKIDKSDTIRMVDTIKEVKDTYPGIFEPFRNQNPITKFWREYNCNLVRFTTGDYSIKMNGGLTYTPSDDSYPKQLWNVLLRMIKG